MMNQAQMSLLRRIADQGLQSNMDVGIGSNVLAALLDHTEETRAQLARLQTDLELTKAALVQAREATEAERRAREIAQAQLRAIADADADALTDQEFARRVRKIVGEPPLG